MAEYNGILSDRSYFEHNPLDMKIRNPDVIISDIDRTLKHLNTLISELEHSGFRVSVWVDDMNETKVKVTLEKELG